MSLKILYVDDEPFMLSAVRRLVSLDGHQLVGINNPQDGIATAKEGEFDLILSDMQMPEMNGVEMVKRIRANGCTLPILFTSGGMSDRERTDMGRMLHEGVVQGFLEKPLTRASLCAAIARLTENPPQM